MEQKVESSSCLIGLVTVHAWSFYLGAGSSVAFVGCAGKEEYNNWPYLAKASFLLAPRFSLRTTYNNYIKHLVAEGNQLALVARNKENGRLLFAHAQSDRV
ncbi:hypothetical protein TERTU_3846 [Teredinibacter turnerae T7901]|uniref:Lipoprotein n=1 Tax=Teredinibacter turnerae (strain ATCC 39867 / T7901) TaxID=377629 RepID=C5BSZ8_TERTT|nr:hypothetical protein TERTU_3846 [Teredinibacter turnerae T7901]